MAENISNLIDDLEDFYDESAGGFKGFVPQGVYPAHIVDMNVKTAVPIKSRNEQGKQHLADIYEFSYAIAEEASSETYKTAEGEDVSGAEFVGKTIKGKGVFKFKSISQADAAKGFIPNPGGNKGFKIFLDAIDWKFDTKEIEDQRGKRTVTILPDLMVDDVKGHPVFVTVAHREWEGREGKTMVSVEVAATQLWKDGTKQEDEIPF